jgi:hypothetical protein
MPSKVFQGWHQSDARRSQLAQLMVQFAALFKLAGRDEQRHDARRIAGVRG